MIFKDIYLYLPMGEFTKPLPEKYCYDFLKGARAVCHYLEREVLMKKKYETKEFNRLVIDLVETPESVGAWISSEKVACVQLAFNKKAYDGEKKRGRYFSEQLRSGIQACDGKVSLPKKELLQALDRYESEGFADGKTYRWLHTSKKFAREKMEAHLYCELSTGLFQVFIEVLAQDKIILQKKIVETDGDERGFVSHFKDIVISKDTLIVQSKAAGKNKIWSGKLPKSKSAPSPMKKTKK